VSSPARVGGGADSAPVKSARSIYDGRVTGSVEQRLRALLREDPIPEVRAEAARALGAIGEPDEATEALVTALDDPNADVRRVVTLALGRIRDARAVDALVAALEERPELWREASAAIAGAGDSDLIDRLLPLLESDSNHVRSGAIRAIAAVSSPSAQGPGEPVFEYTDEEGHRHPLF
jgi:HEAT repeat protein